MVVVQNPLPTIQYNLTVLVLSDTHSLPFSFSRAYFCTYFL